MAQQARASSPAQLPQEAYQYASMYQLGNPTAVYRVSFRSSSVVGILCMLGAGFFVFLALSTGLSDLGVSSNIPAFLILLVLILLCVAGGVYCLVFYPMTHGSWGLFACIDGFVLVKGSKIVACRWDQVAFVWQRVTRTSYNGIYTGTTCKFTVRRADGVEIIFTQDFRNATQLGTQLQREVTRRLTPQALAAVKAGQTLPFGLFNVNWQGLSTSWGMIPWNQIQQVSANRGMVSIQQRGQRRGRSYGGVDKVPNLYVFFNVAHAMSKGQ
jgi:hypothetical protein